MDHNWLTLEDTVMSSQAPALVDLLKTGRANQHRLLRMNDVKKWQVHGDEEGSLRGSRERCLPAGSTQGGRRQGQVSVEPGMKITQQREQQAPGDRATG